MLRVWGGFPLPNRAAFATCLTVPPALPEFLRQPPASALAALRACARSAGAPPCGAPPNAAVKRRRCCGGSVPACVQVSALARAAPRRVRRARPTLALSRCADTLVDVVAAPSSAAGAPVGVASPPAGDAVAPGCAVGAPVGAGVAPEGAVVVPADTVVVPAGAVVAPAGAVVDRVAAPLRALVVSVSEGRRLGALDGLSLCADVGGGGGVSAVGAGGGVAAVPEAAGRVGGGRALAPMGGAGDVRGRELSSDGCLRTCWCGIWLSVAQWELQSGVCACGRRLSTKRARDGPSQSLDVPLVPRMPRPMPDGYG